MRDGFESYRAELEGVRLTEEGKRALTAGLQSRILEEGPARGPRRLSGGLRRGLAAAAVVAGLLSVMTVATVAAVGDPSLRGVISGDSAGYDQSSGIIGRSIEQDGWTVSITDCVGDESYCYIGVEVEAPEGTVLDGWYYRMYADFETTAKGNGGGGDGISPLADEDPTDNKVRLVFSWSQLGAGLNGSQIRLTLRDFFEEFDYNWEEMAWNREVLCEGEWDFGWMTVNFADNVKHIPLAEDIPIEGGDGLLLVDEVVVSPLGVTFHFANKPWSVDWCEAWFDPMLAETVAVLDTEGNPIPIYPSRSGQDMDAGKAYRDYGEGAMYAGWTCYYRFGEKPDPVDVHPMGGFTVVDVERVASLSVGGVTVPLQ